MFYSFLGHLMKLHTNGQLDDLQEISGSSAGALLAFCYTLGKDKIVKTCLEQDLTHLKPNIRTFLRKFGFIDETISRRLISEFCFKFSGNHDITFKEHYEKTKIKLHISAFSLEKHQVDYFSVDTSPNKSLVETIAMSIAVPFVFSPFKNYIDGSLSEDIPYGPFIDKNIEDVYVIRAKSDCITVPTSLYTYLVNFVDIFYSIRHRCPINYPSARLTTDTNILNFKMGYECRLKMYTQALLM